MTAAVKVAGSCLITAERMVREVRPVKDSQGRFWVSREPTGDMFVWCRTHGLDWYGPEAEVRAELAEHEAEHG